MCVIMVIGKTRPTDEMVTRAWDHNRDGAGIAWREGDEVVYKKGIMNLDEIRPLIKKVPTPAVVHFRVASVGGVRKSLTHPFPVSKKTDLSLEGRTKGNLLFHNGHWGAWDDKALDAAIAADVQIPDGEWSDTRAIAWMVSIYGLGFMELLTQQKGVVFGPNTMKVFTGRDGWDKINDVWCSNDNFWRGRTTTTVYGGRLCRQMSCTEKAEQGREYCTKCEAKRSQTVSVDGDDKEDHSSSGDAAKSGTGKGSKDVAVGVMTGRPLDKMLTMDQVSKIYRMGGMSKKKFKDFRKQYQHLGKGGNREKRAMLRLLQLSQQVGATLQTGTVN